LGRPGHQLGRHSGLADIERQPRYSTIRESDGPAGFCRLSSSIQNPDHGDVCIERGESGWLDLSGDDGGRHS
jgi:hypothetical protein